MTIEEMKDQLEPTITPEEYCWQTGKYLSECNCEECEHKDECSGYNG